MHILLIHQAFTALDEAGGTRHYELTRYLVERGYRVTVIASPVSYLTGVRSNRERWLEEEKNGAGLTILRTYTYPALHRSFFHRSIGFFSFMASSFLAGLRVSQVDLVWGTSPPIFQGVTAWLLARLKRVPFLFEVRDLWPAFAVAMGVLRQPLLIRASLWLESFLYRHADRLIVNSPGYVDHVRSRGGKKVDLVPNGADPGMFDPDATGSSFRQEHSLNGKFVVLYAGAHGISNNLEVVLEAAQLLKQADAIQFVLIGDGKEKIKLVEQARQMGLTNVTFLPPVPKNGMPEALACADACVAILRPLELYKTTYPNKVFDYMAAGRPVILAIGGVIQQVVEQACAGIPVTPGDPASLANAVQYLVNHPDQCRKMGQSGRACIEQHFSRAKLAEQLIPIVEGTRKTHE